MTLCVEGTKASRQLSLWASMLMVFFFGETVFGQDVLTWRNDNQRTGQNLNETILTPSNVGSSNFGRLFTSGVDAQVFAQPLYKGGVWVNGASHNVIFVCTGNNSVYAFDADNGARLWQVNFGASTGSYPWQFGVVGTPAIDPSSGTLYCVSITSESGTLVHRLHALDIGSGSEKFGGPVVIQASIPGNGDGSSGGTLSFSSVQVNQLSRPAVLLVNGIVYIAFGGPGDVNPYHGWIMAYNASNLSQVAVYCDSPNAGQGGIWMAGAIAADTSGNIYATSGNGAFDTFLGGAHGNSVIKLDGSLNVLDYFTPASSNADNSHDFDLGSGGCLLLPDQGGSNPHLLIQGGKSGVLRVINRDNMGQYNSGFDNVPQDVNIPNNGNIFSTCAYFWDGSNQWVYLKDAANYGGSSTSIYQYNLSNGTLSGGWPVHSSNDQWDHMCGSPVVSANGSSNGIVWAIEASNPATLRAFNASDVTNTLFNSNWNSANQPGGAGISFTVPMIANGKVYIGTANGVSAYGLKNPPPPPPPPPPPGNSFVLTNQTSGLVMDVTGLGTTGGTPIQQWSYWGGPNQHFFITPTGDGYYYITDSNSGMDLNVPGDSMSPGVQLIIWPRITGAHNSEWSITRNSDGTFTITSRSSGLDVDDQWGGTTNGTPVQQWPSNGTSSQKWSIPGFSLGSAAPPPPSSSGGTFVLTNQDNRLALDVQYSGTTDGTPVWQYTPNGTGAQNWQITPTGDGYFYLTNPNSGKDLNVPGASTTAGTTLIIWDHTPGATNAEWKITSNGDGTFTLINRNSGLALDDQWGGTAVGTPVQQWYPNGTGAQKWIIPGFSP